MTGLGSIGKDDTKAGKTVADIVSNCSNVLQSPCFEGIWHVVNYVAIVGSLGFVCFRMHQIEQQRSIMPNWKNCKEQHYLRHAMFAACVMTQTCIVLAHLEVGKWRTAELLCTIILIDTITPWLYVAWHVPYDINHKWVYTFHITAKQSLAHDLINTGTVAGIVVVWLVVMSHTILQYRQTVYDWKAFCGSSASLFSVAYTFYHLNNRPQYFLIGLKHASNTLLDMSSCTIKPEFDKDTDEGKLLELVRQYDNKCSLEDATKERRDEIHKMDGSFMQSQFATRSIWLMLGQVTLYVVIHYAKAN